MNHQFRSALLLLCGWLVAAPVGGAEPIRGAEPLVPEPGDTIVIIGNTLAERMGMFGYWEPKLHSRFPEHRLTVRNLGWSADEVALRPRSKDFDQHGHELSDHKPEIVIAMYGLNESFAGREGLDAFRRDLQQFIKTTTSTAYNGKTPPLLVLCSPIPHEDLGRRELPDGEQTNANIELYSAAMREAAAASPRTLFVDLYTPMRPRMADPATDLTINGIHLNDAGYEQLAEVLDRGLFGEPPTWEEAKLAKLREAVLERNEQFYYDYRAVNGYYIYGGRKNPYGVVNFPAEFAKLRAMIAVRDQRIWDLAAGRPVSAEIDDSGTGELPAVESNVAEAVTHSTPEESLKKFKVPEGFEVELVASEVEFPDLQNPVAFKFDERGRIWVSTMPSYPMYLPGTPPDDKILILEDSDGDGRMDKQTVFADGLHLPIGFVLGDGGVYVSQQPNLVFLQDTDGDDVADVRKTILHGFDSADSHHSISAFTWGPGGAMYFQEGTFHHTQVETPRGPRRVKDAAVFRYAPRTEDFEIFVSYPFANPWGHCFDRWGQNFVADASGGANYYGTAFSGQVVYPDKHRRMEAFLVKQWRPTCGCLMVSSRNFPDEMQGNYLLNNTIGFLGTLQYRVRDDGSGFSAEPVEPLLSSTDTNFRPVDLSFGPNGALYLVDWFNPLIGHMQHNLRDPKRDKHHGRIWRVRYTQKPLLEPPQFEGASLDQLVELLGAYEDATRLTARTVLRTHPTEDVLAALERWLDKVEREAADPTAVEHAHLEALWVRQHHDAVDRKALERVLQSPDPRARAAATRVLCYWRGQVDDAADLLVRSASDEHPRVRLEAVRAASFLDAPEGRRVVAAAMQKPLDYYLNYTIGETTTTLDRRGGSESSGAADLSEQLAESQVPQPQLVSVIRLAARTATPVQLGKIFGGVLAGPYESQVKADALAELAAAAATRKVTPVVDANALLAAFRSAVAEGRPGLAAELARVAGDWQVSGTEGALQSAAFDPDTAGEVIQASLTALTQFSTPTASDSLSSLTRQPIPVPLRLRAAAALAAKRSGQAKQLFVSAFNEGTDDYELVRLVVAAYLGKQNGAAELASVVKNSQIDTDSAKLILRAMYAAGNSDAELLATLQKAAGIDGQSKMSAEEKQQLIARIEREGDPHAGQWIYRREELNCIKCHALSGAGGQIGPDLSGVGVTSPVEYLLDSILLPSQQIKEAYATLNVLTVDGSIVRGVKVDSDEERLVLRDVEGREIVIAADDIEAETEGPSLMPEGLHHLMTERELIDVVAFLSALGKPGDFVVNSRPTVQRFEVLADPAVKKRLAALGEGELEAQLDAIDAAAWQPAYALVDGRLPTTELTKVSSDAPVILRGTIDVVVGGPVAVRVAPAENLQVVLAGQSLAPNGSQTTSLSEGRHHVYVVSEQGELPKELTVEVVRGKDSATQLTIVGGN
ncbi:PVC-type heme-binding CxxCH protein [Candidatus Laterigemmans baculatus]|uniref:PVC-type heme-binding CxxCH protein n=1 Tax=Candidatus Laterigemmans baculatus TaxID=2770505 RepID=UPI001F20B8FB|nr:PVC-type heme-binding CxxCH protein [Candidatus Laterigemmans baculatus]